MEIKQYKGEYKEKVIELILHIQQNEFAILINAEDQPDLANISTYYQHGKGNFWVAKVNKDIIGTISLLDIGAGNLALRKMFVKKDYRGSETQTALKLLDAALDWATQQQANSIYLGTTEKFFAAHRFYEKNNFREIQKNDLPEKFPIMDVDKKFYQRKL